mmetsp:Transcript_48736/g.113787  ORF Transcript_48736/g.113787 Transcript_48736/m.113787 type:complete len:227 (+) Transcript_48736:41-721(+)
MSGQVAGGCQRLATHAICKAFTSVGQQRRDLDDFFWAAFNLTTSLLHPSPAQSINHRSCAVWAVCCRAWGVFHRRELFLTPGFQNSHAAAHWKHIENEGLQLQTVIAFGLHGFALCVGVGDLLVGKVEHGRHVWHHHVCQEVDGKIMIANVAGPENQPTCVVALRLAGVVELTVFHHTWSSPFLGNNPNLLVWTRLPNALVAAVGILGETVPDKARICWSAKRIVH